ncbi:MAG: HNH endonuclease [Patescibacteria group bacterium]
MTNQNYKNRDWLYSQYIIQQKSIEKIAKENHNSRWTIYHWLLKHKIPTRNKIESHPSKIFLTKQELSDKYWKENKSFKDIAKEYNVCHATIQNLFNKFNLPRRQFQQLKPKGKDSWSWKGGFFIRNGYKFIKTDNHPTRSHNGYVPEHILVMEQNLNRILNSQEVVHHKDGNKLNNILSNLKLFNSEKEHQAYEQRILLFAKQLLWSNNKTNNRRHLIKLFDKFVKEQG